MGMISRLAVVSVVGIAVLLAILFEMSGGSSKPAESTAVAPANEKPVGVAEIEAAPQSNKTTPVIVDEPVAQKQMTGTPEVAEGKGELAQQQEVSKQQDVPKQEISKQETPKQKVESEKFYVIKRGDTLYSIAKANYGDSSKWTLIWESNKDVISDPARLPVGAKIKIPPVEEAKASPLAEGETYIVQKGDTLTKISLIHYGKPDYANLIFEANRATIQEPGKLRVGMVLNIPPVPVKGH